MIKILHAADFHLDSPFAALGEEKAAQMRVGQRRQLDTMAALAGDVDIVLLSGDLFDSGRAYGETVDALRDFFDKIKAHIFIAPGNHDYYAPQSPYSYINFPENVHIFTAESPACVELESLNCVVWGSAFLSQSAEPPLRSFSVEDRSRINIMVLHGDTEIPRSSYGAISAADIENSGLDYLALGHIHSFSGIRRTGDTTWAYPGCSTGRGFDEQGEKGLIKGTVSKQGCELSFIPLVGRRYAELAVDITGFDSAQAALLSALPSDAAENIYRIILTGEWEEKLRLPDIAAGLEDKFWHLELRDETRLKKDVWAAAGEDTLKGNFLRILKSRYDTATDEADRSKIVMAARFGLAALEYREDI